MKWILGGVVVFVVACGGDAKPEQPKDFSDQELSLDLLASGTLDDAIGILDIDGDGIAGQDDIRDLEECIAQEDVTRCDLDGNGVADGDDLILAKLWIGYREPRSAETVTALTDGLDLFATGQHELSADPDIQQLFSDHNGDDLIDATDVALLVAQLRDSPVARLDQTGDQVLDLDDVQEMTRLVSRAFFGQDNPLTDLSGDGVFDEADLRLVTSMSYILNKTHPGYLDTNGDHAIDEEDYCHTSNHPNQRNFFIGLLPEADADAAFAAVTPDLLVCRRDGRNITRFPSRLNTDTDYVLRPKNLYLSEVSAVPVGYELGGEAIPSGSALYVISTAETSNQLQEVRIPWKIETGASNGPVFAFSGDTLPANAVLLLPSSFTLLAISSQAAGSGFSALIEAPTVKLEIFRAAEITARSQFFDRLNVTVQRALDAKDCDPELSTEDKSLLLGYVIKYAKALTTLEDYVNYRLQLQESSHQALLTNHVGMMTSSATAWGGMQDLLWRQAGAETALLVADIAKEGNLGGAFKASVENLVSEYLTNDPNELPVYLTGEGDMLSDMLDGLPKELATLGMSSAVVEEGGEAALTRLSEDVFNNQTFTEILGSLFKATEGVPAKEVLKRAGGKLFENLQGLTAKGVSKEVVKTLVITVIKNIPKMYVNYQIRAMLEADLQVVAGAQAYAASAKRSAVWNATKTDIQFARAELDALAADLTDAFGVGADVSEVVQCSVVLEQELAMADDQYEIDIAEAVAVIEGLQDDLKSDDLTLFATCHNGDLQRQLDRAGARLQIANLRADSDADSGTLAGRVQTVADRNGEFESQAAIYETACMGRLDDLGVVSRTVADLYLEALDEVGLAQADLATARDAAWAVFELCDTSNASPFVFSVVDVTGSVPWDADKGIASLFPPVCLPESSIPDTGLTQCWGTAYDPLLSCPLVGEAFYGQDGHYQLQPMNFEADVGNTIVNDLVTGLTWEWRDPDTFPAFYGDHASAVSYCDSLVLGGLSDWRLPSVFEGQMILDYSRLDFRNPAFEPAPIGVTLWTSTVDYDFGGGKEYFGIATDTGFIRNGVTQNSDRNYLCVRGTPLETNSLVDNADLTVTDTGTGLMWQQDTQNENPSTTWQEALAVCEALGLAGHGDWRLPSIRELTSLVVGNRQDNTVLNAESLPIEAAMDNQVFTTTTGVWDNLTYWSGTIKIDDGEPIAIDFFPGQSFARSPVNASTTVRCVRNP